MTPSFLWKLVLAAALGAAILVSALARAPRRPVPTTDLQALVAGALLLYLVGLTAALSHRPTLAAVLYGSGIATSALAGWLSRGSGSDEPPGHRDPPADPLPPDLDGLPEVDWDALERQFRTHRREPVG
jgi:hypothetical protein